MPSAPEAASESPAAQGFAAWLKNKSDPRFTDWLRELSEPTWTQATEHRFTRELADDTLDDAVFRHYLVQDYSFVDRFVSLLGFAIGRAPSLAERIRLSSFLDAVTSEENTYFQRAFEALGVPEADREAPRLARRSPGLYRLMVTWQGLPGLPGHVFYDLPGHVFYDRLNEVLAAAAFERFAEDLCRPYYAALMGRPSIPPGRENSSNGGGIWVGLELI